MPCLYHGIPMVFCTPHSPKPIVQPYTPQHPPTSGLWTLTNAATWKLPSDSSGASLRGGGGGGCEGGGGHVCRYSFPLQHYYSNTHLTMAPLALIKLIDLPCWWRALRAMYETHNNNQIIKTTTNIAVLHDENRNRLFVTNDEHRVFSHGRRRKKNY